jgi:hypothetical protein
MIPFRVKIKAFYFVLLVLEIINAVYSPEVHYWEMKGEKANRILPS